MYRGVVGWLGQLGVGSKFTSGSCRFVGWRAQGSSSSAGSDGFFLTEGTVHGSVVDYDGLILPGVRALVQSLGVGGGGPGVVEVLWGVILCLNEDISQMFFKASFPPFLIEDSQEGLFLLKTPAGVPSVRRGDAALEVVLHEEVEFH